MKYTVYFQGHKIGVATNKQHLKQILSDNNLSDKSGVTITHTKK